MAKRKRRRLSDKQLIGIAAGSSFLIFGVLLLGIFKDDIIKEPTPDVDWGEVQEEGEISVENTEETPEIIDEYVDENKIAYERKNIYSMGLSVYLPKDWNVNADNTDVVYISSNKENLKGVEIMLTTKPLDIKHPDNLAHNMLYFNKNSLRYHIHGYEFDCKTYAINTDMLSYLYDPEKIVWVDTSDPANYIEVDEVVDASTGKWEKRNKFIGIKETGGMNMFAKSDSSVTTTAIYDFFYTFNGDTEIFIAVMAQPDQAVYCDEVFDVVTNSLEYIEAVDNIYLPSFSNIATLGNVKFKYPSHFEDVSNGRVSQRFENKNLDTDDFGIGISAYTVDFEDPMYMTENIQEYIDYKYRYLQTFTNKLDDDLFYSSANEVVLSYGDNDSAVIDGKSITKLRTQLFLRNMGTEIEVKTGRSYPIKAITYLIPDGQYMQVINITYGVGNEKIAEKYARALEKTIEFIK